MTASLAGAVSFMLFLIRDLDNPFRGEWRVSPGPLLAAVGLAGRAPPPAGPGPPAPGAGGGRRGGGRHGLIAGHRRDRGPGGGGRRRAAGPAWLGCGGWAAAAVVGTARASGGW